MKNLLTKLFLTGSALIILDSINPVHLLTLFLFAGIIPGTHIAVSAIDMMAAFATAFMVVVLRLTLWPKVKIIFFETPKKSTTKTVKQN